MGCAQSKVDNEESVARCKERKILMKEAVVARNAFAAGHSGYAISLKNTGAALSDYAQGEVQDSHSHLLEPPIEPISQPPPPPPPPPSMDSLPPPPPLPNFSPSPIPIKRALSMPAIPMMPHLKPGEKIDSMAIAEEDEDDDELDHGARNGIANDNKTKNKDLNGSRGPPNGKVRPEETPDSSPRTLENHAVPPMPESKNMAWDYFFKVDDMPGPSLEPEVDTHRNVNTFGSVEDLSVRFGGIENPTGAEVDAVEPKTPEKPEEHLATVAEEEEEEEDKEPKKERHIEHSKTAPPDFRVVGKKVVQVPTVNLMQVLSEIDDHFLKASESAQEVSKMLEATRLHYHSNFADNRGIIVQLPYVHV